jgi:hypothetical protein
MVKLLFAVFISTASLSAALCFKIDDKFRMQFYVQAITTPMAEIYFDFFKLYKEERLLFVFVTITFSGIIRGLVEMTCYGLI